MPFCPKCGKPFVEGNTFCGACGQRLDFVVVRDAVPVQASASATSTDAGAGATGNETSQDSQSPARRPSRHRSVLVAVATCALVVAVGLAFILLVGVPSSPRDEGAGGDSEPATFLEPRDEGYGTSEADVSPNAADEEAPASSEDEAKAQIYVCWPNDVVEKFGVVEEGGAIDVRYPLFSTNSDASKGAVGAINKDVEEWVEEVVELHNTMGVAKSWASNELYPQITYVSDDYLAIHYYYVNNFGTVGTLSIGGGGAIYSLRDGSRVNAAQMLGTTQNELVSLTRDAIRASGIEDMASYSWSLEEALGDEGNMFRDANFVVLPDGVYVYLRGLEPGAGGGAQQQTFHLVGVCGLDLSEDSDVVGKVVDLASDEQFAYYRDLERPVEPTPL